MKLRPQPAPASKGRLSAFCSILDTHQVCEFDGTDALDAPLIYYSELLQQEAVVPVGFITDYASVPRWIPFAQMILAGKGKRAAVIHDWLYSGGLVNGRALTRKECDDIFAEALRATGYGWLVTNMMYSGVRVGGESHFVAPNQPQIAAVADRMAEISPG